MNRYNFSLIRFSLGLIILFSFFTIVKAQNYELLIITPAKFETVARDFLILHETAAQPIRGCYTTMEDIYSAYDGQPPDQVPPDPSPAEAPDVPTPGEDEIGEVYGNEPARMIIKFLRGVLGFPEEYEDPWDGYVALALLHDSDGDHIYPPSLPGDELRFQYLLLLGETGAAGPTVSTLNGVPESWYVFMDHDEYDQDPGADDTWFPTDFFYASPDYDFIPNLKVGRLPVHDLDVAITSGNFETVENDTRVLNECDLCDSDRVPLWVASQYQNLDYDVVITSNGDGDDVSAVGATYLILDNTDTCLTVFGDPTADGVEGESPADEDNGDSYIIQDTKDEAQDMYNKCVAYLTAVELANSWNTWFRKVVTAGGDSSFGWWSAQYRFSFWDEFVLAYITNQGSFEGNEITKLRHTNTDDGVAGNDFDTASLAPYFQDDVNSKDCGLLFHLGDGTGTELFLDDYLVDTIDTTDLLGYTSTNSHIPIVVSNAGWGWDGSGRFDRSTPSFGASVVESPAGAGIAYIGSTDLAYSGIIPSFDNGVLDQARLYNFDELLSYTIRSFHSPGSSHPVIGDMFMGSPASGEGGNPVYDFINNNDMEFWANQKTVWEYTLLGDPCLPIPYPQSTPIETGTSAPTLAFDESTLRNRIPQYESHDIGVDEIPTGGSASTTVNITPVDSPSTVPQVKITRVDIRRDLGRDYPTPASPANYTFATPNDEPGYYFIKVEQPGWDNLAGGGAWGSWWEKESWIYVQEVNQFTPANNILVVDDDLGYPIVTTPNTDGYEDWYLNTLDELGQSYDVWHVDFDDNLFNLLYPGPEDDWAGIDAGDALMHGEAYESLLANYTKVIWLTGDPDGYLRPYPHETEIWLIETLTSPEQTYLENYLDNEGRLFLSGQNITKDLQCRGDTEGPGELNYCYWTTLDNEFLSNYLHLSAIYAAWPPHGRLDNLKSILGNPIIEDYYGINIAGHEDGGAENQYIWGDAEPDSDTPIVAKVFEYDFSAGNPPTDEIGDTPFFGTAGTAHYQGCGANVFFPWGFEAIDSQRNRNEVMAAVLSWLDSPTLTGPFVGCPGEEDGGGDGGNGGDGGGAGSLKGCFIATACYGTPMAKEIEVLSHFRDEYLMTNSLGRFFVGSYYKFSPYLAEYISRRPLLKKFVRIGLKPLVKFSKILVVSEEKQD